MNYAEAVSAITTATKQATRTREEQLADALEIYRVALHNASEEIKAKRGTGQTIAIECEYLQKAQEELGITLREAT